MPEEKQDAISFTVRYTIIGQNRLSYIYRCAENETLERRHYILELCQRAPCGSDSSVLSIDVNVTGRGARQAFIAAPLRVISIMQQLREVGHMSSNSIVSTRRETCREAIQVKQSYQMENALNPRQVVCPSCFFLRSNRSQATHNCILHHANRVVPS